MQFLVQGYRTSFLTCREIGVLKIYRKNRCIVNPPELRIIQPFFFGAHIAFILGHGGAGSGTVIIKEILILVVGCR